MPEYLYETIYIEATRDPSDELSKFGQRGYRLVNTYLDPETDTEDTRYQVFVMEKVTRS